MRIWLAVLTMAVAGLAGPATAMAHDAFPCSGPRHAAWSHWRVQKCDLGHPYAHGRIPVYRAPVTHARGARLPTQYGYLGGAANQYFVCQRRYPRAVYYHLHGWRNVWWAYTKSDDHKWGWLPEVFFRGGGNDEADGGLQVCGSDIPGAPKPPPKPRPPAPRCASYYILGLRGSGQALDGPLKMGTTVGITAENAVAQLHRDHPGAVGRTYSIPYPAAPVGKIFTLNPNQFARSIVRGVALLKAKIHAIVAGCPRTSIGVIGYSQGAGVASRTMRLLPAATLRHIRMLTLYADPYSSGQSSYSLTYNYKNRRWVAERWGGGIFNRLKLPAALPHKLGFCFLQDAVCSWPSNVILRGIVASTHYVHSHYVNFVSDDGQRLVTVVGQETARAMER